MFFHQQIFAKFSHCALCDRSCPCDESLEIPSQGVALPVSYDQNSPAKRLLGYARVSTYGQTLDAQLEQLRGAS
jgi:hypothetical protein